MNDYSTCQSDFLTSNNQAYFFNVILEVLVEKIFQHGVGFDLAGSDSCFRRCVLIEHGRALGCRLHWLRFWFIHVHSSTGRGSILDIGITVVLIDTGTVFVNFWVIENFGCFGTNIFVYLWKIAVLIDV